jgi:antitoxin PrlF
MGTGLKVTAKGQVTLRKELLDHLNVSPGERIVVEFLPGGRAELRSGRPRATIDDFIGCLKRHDGTTLSIEEINQFAADGWSGKR